MNPQYMPQQPYGAPPPQGYLPSRPSPSLTPRGGANVPPGPPKQFLPGPNQPPSNYVPNSFQSPPPGPTLSQQPGHLNDAEPPVGNQFGPPGTGQLPSNIRPPMSNPILLAQQPPQNQLPPKVGGLNSTSQNPLQNSQFIGSQNGSSLGQNIPPASLPQSNQPFQSQQPPLTINQPSGPTLAGPPGNSLQSNQFGPPGNISQSHQFGPSGSKPGQNQFGQPQFPPQNQFGPPPVLGQNPPQPMPSGPPINQFNQPPSAGLQRPLATPVGQPVPLGQPNFLSQPGQPQFQTHGPPHMSGHPHLSNQPPIHQYGPPAPPQLANQMQGMSLGGTQRQYPGGPLKQHILNGDGGPHMPPAMPQQNYMNGQQMRSPPGPGYPPIPGQGGPVSGPVVGPGGYPQPSYQQPQQQGRRLDPDQMPSPIQVTQDDQKTRSGIFCTNQKGLVPPLVTTKFVVQDQGNASPRFVRSTMYNVPVTQDLMKQTSVPFGLVISPMARTTDQEYAPPIVNFGELGPVRCIRCKAYMCPYMQFIDSGRRFQCLFCKAATDVPSEYFQHLDHTGQRMDRYERPELVLGTYEFTATKDYCRNNTFPKPPAIIFLIDVSYNNIKSGLVHLLCAQMKEIIKHLPLDQGQDKSNMRVGFITYNNTVHFYNVKSNLAAPQMLVVGDVQEMFMPLLDGFLCTPEESSPVIDALMQQIPAMFGDTRETETVLLPAILAGLEALKASECTGKLLVFHSTLPIAEAPGKLKNRDDRKLLGTDKEKTVLTPQTQAYSQLGQDCVASGCSVDLFLFNNAYIDIATIGQVSRLSGGEIFKYTYFQADLDGDRLIEDIIMNISRPIAFDAIMRVRTSTGVRPTDFYGHFYMSNTTDIELASIDCDKAIAVEIKHDDKLAEDEGVYIQIALLFTSCAGVRRLRIINLSLKTCSQMADLYRSCDLDTLVNFFGKQAVYKLLENNPKAVKDHIVNRAAHILANYRKNCASPSSAGQLILPECMKLLPLYVNCLLKNDALSGGSDITVDDRSFVMHVVMTMDIQNSVSYFYPRLIPLHELQPEEDPLEIPPSIRCSIEKMSEQGVYILENGIHMFLWIGLGANPDFIQQVFGVPSAIQVDIDRIALPALDNPLSKAVHSIIEQIRIQRHHCMRLTFVRQREKLEPVFKQFLIEDRGIDGSPSYVDFLCHMHKEIRTILS